MHRLPGDGDAGLGALRLTVALAGHPPPVLIDREGEARQVGQPGTLLGVLDPIDVVEREDELRAGETLLLYTDGVPRPASSGEAARASAG